MLHASDVIVPEWPAPPGVKALITTRRGGVSTGQYASLNLGAHVGDDNAAVQENRRRVSELMPAAPVWMDQVHGTQVIEIGRNTGAESRPVADAAMTRLIGRPCAVMVADCLPILFCDDRGSCVAAAHAGWRGLAAGVLERTIEAMLDGTGIVPENLMAYLGPAIGPTAFEVGQDVVDVFAADEPGPSTAFKAIAGKPEKYLADIVELARRRLQKNRIAQIYRSPLCTVSESEQFFSFRRDGTTGRTAAVIWRE